VQATVVIGSDAAGACVQVDVEELLASRLLVQGNSGSGKSHLLRRLLEESAAIVQQVVIDPEGDFVTLGEAFGHVVVDGAAYSSEELVELAARARRHRASVVLALDGLEIEAQMRCAAQFLSALFDAPREEWFPVLVVVDEAQMFAPAGAGEVSDEARRLSLAAMTNLMCRGRKRGLAGVIATQRLAKLAKNVAAEASNFLMGRTFLDIDMARAADLLGMERRQAEAIRDLERGHFLGLGPAIARRPVSVRIGPVKTSSRSVSHALAPPPSASGEDLHALLHAELAAPERKQVPLSPVAPPAATAPEALIAQMSAAAPSASEDPGSEERGNPSEIQQEIDLIVGEMARQDNCTFRSAAALYQDFTLRCRMKRILPQTIDMSEFRRRFALAVAGVDPAAEEWAELVSISNSVPLDVLAPFLSIARAAQEHAPCPEDDELARIYGTNSPSRIRRLLEHLEKIGLIVVRTDYGGRRTVSIPTLGLVTAAES
jgi:hypothetical protein